MKHDARKTFGQHWLGAMISYVVIDVLCAGLGMGVPLFCIILGFGVGWFGAMRAEYFIEEPGRAMRRVLRYAWLTSAVTLVMMAVLWGRLVPVLFHPTVDAGNMGLPLWLYEPRLSLAGWILLMVVIAPFMQAVMTAFGAYLTFQRRLRSGWRNGRL
jgi:hypothetical protein